MGSQTFCSSQSARLSFGRRGPKVASWRGCGPRFPCLNSTVGGRGPLRTANHPSSANSRTYSLSLGENSLRVLLSRGSKETSKAGGSRRGRQCEHFRGSLRQVVDLRRELMPRSSAFQPSRKGAKGGPGPESAGQPPPRASCSSYRPQRGPTGEPPWAKVL